MAATQLVFAIFCFGIAGSLRMPDRNLLDVRSRIIATAAKEVGVREKTGQNDGKAIAEYLRSVGLNRPEPYCAAFVCWVFQKEGLSKPRSGWSPDLFPQSRLARSALPGNVIGIYFPQLKRIAHAGLIEKVDGSWISTIEANTNVSGSREGDGVYRKKRHFRTIYRMADWIEKGRALR